MFEVYATTPEGMGPGQIGAHAARAETMGYHGLLVPDAVHDGLLMANNALLATRRLRVGIAVLVAFPRSPMTVAIAAWDLQSLSGGRFELGLGSQIRQNIEDRYATAWTPPARRMREYVESLKAIFHAFQTGEPLRYSGRDYRFSRLQPFFNPGPLASPEPPVQMGAVGPLMTGVAGGVADGLITHPTAALPRYLREVCLPRLAEGATGAGRDPGACQLTLSVLPATGPDAATVAAERERQRNLLGFLFSTPAYWGSLELIGRGELGRQLQQLTRQGDWAGMASQLDDEVLAQFVPMAPYAEIAPMMKARYGGLGSRITFPMPADPAHDAQAIVAIRALGGDS